HKLRRNERCRYRRIDVADDDHEVRPVLDTRLFERVHDPAGLNGMTRRANAEVAIGPRKIEVPEKAPSHRLVVVLAGIDQNLTRALPRVESFDDRRNLHEVWTRADDVHDSFHANERTARGHGLNLCILSLKPKSESHMKR